MKYIDSDEFSLLSWRGSNGHIRATEIMHWLKKHPEVEQWVAIDDIDMSKRPDVRKDCDEWGLEKSVLTPRSTEGIKQSGIKDKVIAILNEKQV